jgi:molecular chaperone GrpE
MADERDRKPEDMTTRPLDPDTGAGPQPSDLAARVAALEAELEAAREEARQANERWIRERADGENLKKRAAKERVEDVRAATASLMRDLLPVVDNLERAVQAAQGGGDGKPLVEGVSLVLKALTDVLGRHGVTRVESKGVRFDPSHHEAVAHVESAEHEPNAVIEEHQPGYRHHDRLLRPALVTVSKGRSGQPPKVAKPQGGD